LTKLKILCKGITREVNMATKKSCKSKKTTKKKTTTKKK